MKRTVTRILLVFGFIANTASILSAWLTYDLAPADTKAHVVKIVWIGSGILAALCYLGLAAVLVRTPKQAITPIQTKDDSLLSPAILAKQIKLCLPQGQCVQFNLNINEITISLNLLSLHQQPIELVYMKAKVYYGSNYLRQVEKSEPITLRYGEETSWLIVERLEPGTELGPEGMAAVSGELKFKAGTTEFIVPISISTIPLIMKKLATSAR